MEAVSKRIEALPKKVFGESGSQFASVSSAAIGDD
jgi:hypothetical protein